MLFHLFPLIILGLGTFVVFHMLIASDLLILSRQSGEDSPSFWPKGNTACEAFWAMGKWLGEGGTRDLSALEQMYGYCAR